MTISVLSTDRIPMSQKERDVLKIMHNVLRGERSQAEARSQSASQGTYRAQFRHGSRRRIAVVCVKVDHRTPIICTPEEHVGA
jgi:hypothetical protein